MRGSPDPIMTFYEIRGRVWDAMQILSWLSYSVLSLLEVLHPGDLQEPDDFQRQHRILCTALSSWPSIESDTVWDPMQILPWLSYSVPGVLNLGGFTLETGAAPVVLPAMRHCGPGQVQP